MLVGGVLEGKDELDQTKMGWMDGWMDGMRREEKRKEEETRLHELLVMLARATRTACLVSIEEKVLEPRDRFR